MWSFSGCGFLLRWTGLSIRRREQAGFSGAPRFRVTTPKSGTTCICWTKGWLQQIFAQETLSASWRRMTLEIFSLHLTIPQWLGHHSKRIYKYVDIYSFSIHVKSYLSSFGIFPTGLVLNINLHILFQKTK